MDLSLTETQTLVQKTARDFATRVLLPKAHDVDEHEIFPVESLKGLAELGLLAVNVPEEFGGAAAGTVSYALAMQEISAACASTAVTMAVTNMVGEIIARFGTKAQAEEHCPKLASCEYLAGSFALSEPGAGSDPGGMCTKARLEGGEWVLNGEKMWITSGAHAGVLIVWARTGDPEHLPAARGLSCFLVPKGAKGLTIGRAEDKMGIRGSNTVSLSFDDCRVPESALLGPLNGGFKIAMVALDGGRIGIASQSVGIARACIAESVQYAKDRRQFKEPLASFQAIQWKLAEMQTSVDAAHLLCMRAALLKEAGQPHTREAAMAKMYASETAVRVANEAVQIHGGYGYIREFPVERHLRDARVTMIYEGTSEVQRMVVARTMIA